MSLQWRELSKERLVAESSDGIRSYVEELDAHSTGKRFYEASVMARDCCSNALYPIRSQRFTSREDAIEYLQSTATD